MPARRQNLATQKIVLDETLPLTNISAVAVYSSPSLSLFFDIAPTVPPFVPHPSLHKLNATSSVASCTHPNSQLHHFTSTNDIYPLE